MTTIDDLYQWTPVGHANVTEGKENVKVIDVDVIRNAIIDRCKELEVKMKTSCWSKTYSSLYYLHKGELEGLMKFGNIKESDLK